MKKARSIIKYPGSKRLMLDRLFKHLPQTGDVLCEPFVGSATVALNSDYREYHLNDANPDLIALFKLCQKKPSDLIIELRKLFVPENNTPERYYEIRKHFNQIQDLEERAVLLMYFNRHGFNGLVRYNPRNEYNVPFGDGKPAYLPELEVEFFSEKLKNAHFYCMDFADFIDHAAKLEGTKTQCYIDPPYLNSKDSNSSFTAYTSTGFTTADHIRINRAIMHHRAAFDRVLVSNHKSHDLVTTYTDSKRTVMFRVPRTISAKTVKRKPVKEVLIYY